MPHHVGIFASRLLDAGSSLALGSGDSADDNTTFATHLVLLCVFGGVLLASALESFQHRLHITWFPESSIAVLTGVFIGGAIRLVAGTDATPVDLTFNGPVFFLVALPIIIFEAGYSLRKREFFGQAATILIFSVIGTAASALIIGGVLYWAGQQGASLRLNPSEALAYGSILSATDALATISVLRGIGGVDRNLMALVMGEGSLNDAVSIVLYQTFASFEEDHSDGSVSIPVGDLVSSFTAELLGSLFFGITLGILATLLFRAVHVGWSPDFADIASLLTNPFDYYAGKVARARAAAIVAAKKARADALTTLRNGGEPLDYDDDEDAASTNERKPFARAYSSVYASFGPLSPSRGRAPSFGSLISSPPISSSSDANKDLGAAGLSSLSWDGSNTVTRPTRIQPAAAAAAGLLEVSGARSYSPKIVLSANEIRLAALRRASAAEDTPPVPETQEIALWTALGSRELPLDKRRKLEPKADSSIFAQTSYIILIVSSAATSSRA